MFDLVFLGTSASAPSVHRGLSSLAVLAGEHRYLVDCGEGTQRQILRSGIGYKRLNRVLLTHGHLDHILGLGGLISTFVRWEGVEEIEIFGGKPALDRVQNLIYGVVLHNERPPIPIHLVDIKPGRIVKARDYAIHAFSVQHRGAGNFGYVFREKDHTPFLVDKAEALGVPSGPERGQLVRGESVTLADGRVITPEMVLGATQPGARLVVVGDVGRVDEVAEHAQDADALVIEATFLEADADDAAAFGHLTAQQAADFARQMGVRSLILNHVSRRYRERDLIAEARAVFPRAYVARDFDHFRVRRGEGAVKIAADSEQQPGEQQPD